MAALPASHPSVAVAVVAAAVSVAFGSLGCGGSVPASTPVGEEDGGSVEVDAGTGPVDADPGAGDGSGPIADASVPAGDAGHDTGTGADSGPRVDSGSDSGARVDSGTDAGVPFAAGTGFSATYTRFSVPPSGLSDGFFSSGYTLGARGWIVIDLDGDRIPDLVQTSDSQNGSGYVWTDLTGPYWRVFKGTGSGFATTPARWSVPASGLPDGFFSAYYGYDTRHWSLYDLDGDGRPELIQPGDPSRAGGFVFTDAQGAYWKVWRSTAAGFASTAARLGVPASGLSDGFFSTAYCLDARCWGLYDLDGDGHLDLVQSADPAASGGKVWNDTSGAYWRVYNGSASGFAATARRFSVPASGLSDGFFSPSYASAAPGTRFWSLLDLDGDRRPDLVQTADPARSGGLVWTDGTGPSWRAFLGGATGFGTAVRVPVPASGLSDGFFAASYFASPTLGGQRVWMTLDLDGDGRPELLQTADTSRQGGYVFSDVQGAYWKVWRLGLGGATGPARWGVPPSGLTDGFFSPYWTDSANGNRSWFLRDLDGDGRQDLVQCADTTRSGLFVRSDAQGAFWKVYRGI